MSTTGEDLVFHCSGCGRCCNSPPRATLAELLHHERRFIGCLTIGVASAQETAGTHGLRGGRRLRLGTRAWGYPSLGRCPALYDDGRCAVHDERKPAVCCAVPLDPALPDGLQPLVLTRRRAEAAFMGADCLRPGPAAVPWRPLLDGAMVVDPAYRASLVAARRSTEEDQRDWGDAVFALLAGELERQPGRLAQAAAGELTLPLTPVFAVLDGRGEASGRHRRYAEAQLALIEASVAEALRRRRTADRPHTEELRRFRAHYEGYLAATA